MLVKNYIAKKQNNILLVEYSVYFVWNMYGEES